MEREKLQAVAQTLRNLFAEKSELVGFDDWDKLIGCIITLEQIAKETGGEDNG